MLAADIGGTNARLAVVQLDQAGAAQVLRSTHYRSRDYSNLADIVRAFQREAPVNVAVACFAVAGPIRGGECHATNLPWVVRATELAHTLGLPSVVLINDFSAVASGLRLLKPADLKTLQAGDPVAEGPLALLGAGTGLGTAFVLQDTTPPRVLPSEAGHMSFAPSSATEDALLSFLRDEFGHVSYERVLSGAGLVNVYRFLAASDFAPENPAVCQEMDTEDPAAVITRHAAVGTDRICAEAVEMFVSVYGAHAGNLALAMLATGGVFIAGGIAPRIVAQLAAGSFLKAFLAKGRLADFIAAIPVHVIINPDVGLLGAAAVGAETARRG